MAQLSADSFAFGGKLRRLDDALDDLATRLAAVADTETVPVMQAQRGCWRTPVSAPFAIPNFDNSAVDGYAVRFADLALTARRSSRFRFAFPPG